MSIDQKDSMNMWRRFTIMRAHNSIHKRVTFAMVIIHVRSLHYFQKMIGCFDER